jgi:DNA invertase Pin-like site-specific DNA recombinase
MMMQMVGAFAEFERAMIGERPRAGRKTAAQMARLHNVSEVTVSRLMAVHRQAVLPWQARPTV